VTQSRRFKYSREHIAQRVWCSVQVLRGIEISGGAGLGMKGLPYHSANYPNQLARTDDQFRNVFVEKC